MNISAAQDAKMVHTEGLFRRRMVQMGDGGMLLIQFGFAEAKKIRGNIAFLFEHITKLQPLFVNGDAIDVSKFAPSSVGGFREKEFITKMVAMGVGRMGR
jgi:hypothetical protein